MKNLIDELEASLSEKEVDAKSVREIREGL